MREGRRAASHERRVGEASVPESQDRSRGKANENTRGGGQSEAIKVEDCRRETAIQAAEKGKARPSQAASSFDLFTTDRGDFSQS